MSPDPNKNYYNILDIPEDADTPAIKSAYRKLAQKYHPDRDTGDEAKFQEIEEAYRILSNNEKRQEYEFLRQNPRGHSFRGGINMEDIFNQFRGFQGFEDFPGDIFNIRRDGTSYRVNTIVEHAIQISIQEAYTGVSKDVSVNGNSYTIDIPAGVDNGNRMRLQNLHDESQQIIFKIYVINNTSYRREKSNLILNLTINCFEAIIGTTKTIETISNKKLNVTIHPGLQPGQTIALRGKGMPILNGSGYGDLYIVVNVSIPKNLTTEQKQMLSELINTN